MGAIVSDMGERGVDVHSRSEKAKKYSLLDCVLGTVTRIEGHVRGCAFQPYMRDFASTGLGNVEAVSNQLRRYW